jgi:branched-chain amino acid transport system substrate-binding protein
MNRRSLLAGAALTIAAAPTLGTRAAPGATSAMPIRIGFGIALTGGFAVTGKMARLGMEIWRDDINARGGLLGRPVELVGYDDRSDATLVPGIYTTLIDRDQVDFLIGGCASPLILPALQVAIANNRLLLAPFGPALSRQFDYPFYFAMPPAGAAPARGTTRGFFELAAMQKPPPRTLAIIADAADPRGLAEAAREHAAVSGLRIVHDSAYLPTADYAALLRAAQAAGPDIVFVAACPPASAAIVRAAGDIRLKTSLFGGGIAGLQLTATRQQLGALLNGVVTYDFWLPAPTLRRPAAAALLAQYRARAPSAGADPLGCYPAPWAYAALQVLGQSIAGAGSRDPDKVAPVLQTTTFETVIGSIALGPNRELSQPHTIFVQYQHLKDSNLAPFADGAEPVILWPVQYRDGNLLYPYGAART